MIQHYLVHLIPVINSKFLLILKSLNIKSLKTNIKASFAIMKKLSLLISFVLLLIAAWFSLYRSTPHSISGLDTPSEEFSTLRALDFVKNIAKAPHYLGSTAHEESKRYIINELQKMGLQTQIQEGYSIYKTGELSQPQNIIARIKGSDSKKALVLLSHYDSDPHSAVGASDAASGVATILEGVRAFLATNKKPKNDIIICFTDGEELGLNGAKLFVNKHPWAKKVGLVLNFEARGSGGESFMLVETNTKNGQLIEEFTNANPSHPAANSLAYSIYKMLPNDTDLTVFREEADIEGFNFAFIGDHFDYHTANDTWENLDLNTLQHQGSYLMPLLNYFADADLSSLKSNQDYIYFDVPVFKLVKYPFSWIFPMLFFAIILFIAIIIYGKSKQRIHFKFVFKGLWTVLLSLILTGAIGFGLWKVISLIYPHYSEIQHGFTYNGYTYILVFVALALAISFKIYGKFNYQEEVPSMLVAPLFLWLVVSAMVAIYLKGASYFIIPAFFGLISLWITIRQKEPNSYLLTILALPAIFIITPFIKAFPVALGLGITFVSGILTVFLFSLLLPVLAFITKKHLLSHLAFGVTLVALIYAHTTSSFAEGRQKPNSLVYFLDKDTNEATWATYDQILDPWTEKYINVAQNDAQRYNTMQLDSKYGKQFSFTTKTDVKDIPEPNFIIVNDAIIQDQRTVTLAITPRRSINRMDVYTNTIFNFDAMEANGVTTEDFNYGNKTYNAFTKRWKKGLVTYHVNKNRPLQLKMTFHKDSVPTFTVIESSFDLLSHPKFTIENRSKDMMPKPFTINDAVMTKKSFKLIYTPPKKVVDSLSLPLKEN